MACERMIPRVHADNKEELKRIRAMTAARKLEEIMLNQALELQEGALRAQERAQARQAREREEAEARPILLREEARRIRDEYLARRQVFDQQRVQEEHDPHMPDLIARHQQREAADQRLEAALEGLAQFDGALQRREVELARLAQHAGDMRRLGVEEQRARQERDRIAFREREARAAQNVMQGLPEEREAELRQALEGAGFNQINLANRRHEPMETATENELARMVALPVLRETAVEATECPICIEDLGEVGKTVLKCGHTLCVSCFLQQMMRATAASRARECKCPVCRVGYIV